MGAQNFVSSTIFSKLLTGFCLVNLVDNVKMH